MNLKLLKSAFFSALKQFLAIFSITAVLMAVIYSSYYLGYVSGYNIASASAQQAVDDLLADLNLQVSSRTNTSTIPSPTPRVVTIQPTQRPFTPNWSGPELWEAVNKRRVELGVNGLGNQSELCTIASIRLNELLELGKLDGHEGFSTLPERREDLKWIFDKYNISEFLVSGAQSAAEAVSLWENTLGHNKLLTGGEYVWGCTYAQNGFGVAITAY